MYTTRRTVQSVLPVVLSTPKFKEKLYKLDAIIVEHCGDPVTQAEIDEFP